MKSDNKNERGDVIMKTILAAIIFSFLVTGCVAHVTPEGTYLEPLPVSIVVGPPVIAPPPHRHIVLRQLPPIMVHPERRVYFYNKLYYYHWNNLWYYGVREAWLLGHAVFQGRRNV